jgi:hypothetical protein
VLEVISRAKVLELRLYHRAKVAGRVMSELYYPARIALKNQDHSTPDLGGRHCHIGIPELGSKALRSSSAVGLGSVDRNEA